MVGPHVLGPIARPLDDELTLFARLLPLARLVAFFLGDQVQPRLGQHFLKHLQAKDAPVHQQGQDLVGTPLAGDN